MSCFFLISSKINPTYSTNDANAISVATNAVYLGTNEKSIAIYKLLVATNDLAVTNDVNIYWWLSLLESRFAATDAISVAVDDSCFDNNEYFWK